MRLRHSAGALLPRLLPHSSHRRTNLFSILGRSGAIAGHSRSPSISRSYFSARVAASCSPAPLDISYLESFLSRCSCTVKESGNIRRMLNGYRSPHASIPIFFRQLSSFGQTFTFLPVARLAPTYVSNFPDDAVPPPRIGHELSRHFAIILIDTLSLYVIRLISGA